MKVYLRRGDSCVQKALGLEFSVRRMADLGEVVREAVIIVNYSHFPLVLLQACWQAAHCLRPMADAGRLEGAKRASEACRSNG